ncbi:MAG TPA: class I tRNA ligase family protein, partial [Terriglobales bacterium]|nr:class I tRNA ligase family protein [Terriglobales bacterium]
ILLLLAPITPFITDHVWLQVYAKESVHLQEFPKAAWPKTSKRHTAALMEFNREVWKTKKEKNLALRDQIEVDVPKALAPFKRDLVKMHSLVVKP